MEYLCVCVCAASIPYTLDVLVEGFLVLSVRTRAHCSECVRYYFEFIILFANTIYCCVCCVAVRRGYIRYFQIHVPFHIAHIFTHSQSHTHHTYTSLYIQAYSLLLCCSIIISIACSAQLILSTYNATRLR